MSEWAVRGIVSVFAAAGLACSTPGPGEPAATLVGAAPAVSSITPSPSGLEPSADEWKTAPEVGASPEGCLARALRGWVRAECFKSSPETMTAGVQPLEGNFSTGGLPDSGRYWVWIDLRSGPARAVFYRQVQDVRIELRVGGSADAPAVEWLMVPPAAAGACRTGDVEHAGACVRRCSSTAPCPEGQRCETVRDAMLAADTTAICR